MKRTSVDKRPPAPFPRVALVLCTAMALLIAGCAGNDDASGTDEDAASAAAGLSDESTDQSQGTTSTTSTTAPSTETSTEAPSEPAPISPSCATRAAGVDEFVSDAGGVSIDVRVFVPDDAGQDPLPVVLDWHGLGSTGTQQAILSAYEDLARVEDFIAVHPTGAPTAGSTQNAWELAQFDVPGRDDLIMADEVIDRLVDDYCADPARIYSTGFSNGGFFTALLVCERADRIAAAVSVGGVSHPEGCQPSRPVPFIAFHGTDDEVVRYNGGPSSLQTDATSTDDGGFFGQSMPGEFAQFAASFDCASEPEPTSLGDEVTRYDYGGCADDVPLSFYEIANGGHTWPGSALGPLLTESLGRTTDEVDATAEGWDFLRQFALPETG